jgi:multimeric flavodoxin WrbA
MTEADLIILASPVYVYHTTGAMKVFLDHYGYQWMVHRPRPEMFHKQGICISTAAGAGCRPASRDMADSLRFWGIPGIYAVRRQLLEGAGLAGWGKTLEIKQKESPPSRDGLSAEQTRGSGRQEGGTTCQKIAKDEMTGSDFSAGTVQISAQIRIRNRWIPACVCGNNRCRCRLTDRWLRMLP